MRRPRRDRRRREAFSRLVALHQTRLVVLARRLVGERDAEDVLQASLAAAWKRFGLGDELRNPRAWLLTFVVYESRNVIGRRSRRSSAADVYDADPASSLEDAFEVLQRELAHDSSPVDPRALLECVAFLLRAVGASGPR